MNSHLQEIESLQNSLREREEYVIELENRLRALWDKLEGERKHYMEQICRLEEAEDVIKVSLQRSLNSNEQGECKWLAELPMTDAEFAVFTTAFKAKEDKP